MTEQIKTLQDEITAEQPQLVRESTVMLDSKPVDILTTLGHESLPSQGGQV